MNDFFDALRADWRAGWFSQFIITAITLAMLFVVMALLAVFPVLGLLPLAGALGFLMWLLLSIFLD